METQSTPATERVYQQLPEPPLFSQAEVAVLNKHAAVMDFEERIAFAADAAREAYDDQMQAAAHAAAAAFQSAMGPIDTVPNIRLFIASLARAMKDGSITANEAQKLLNVAERALGRHAVAG